MGVRVQGVLCAVLLSACASDFGLTERGEIADPLRPVIDVQPELIDFDGLVSGESRTELVTISNVGFHTLHIDDIRLQGDAGFQIDTLGGPSELERGESITVEVTFSPVDDGAMFGQIVVASEAAERGHEAVDLVARGSVPLLDIWPDPLDLGEDWVGCEMTGSFELSNVGSMPLELKAWHIEELPAAFGELVLHGTPGSGLQGPVLGEDVVLQPGEVLEVPVSFASGAPGDLLGTLVAESNDPRGVRDARITVGSDYYGYTVDSFVAPAEPPVSVLFAIDQSGSMTDQRADLAAAFSGFISDIASATGNWRVGVVTDDLGCVNEGVITADTPNREEVFTDAVNFERFNFLTEKLLQLTDVALSRTGPGDCNDGFLDPYGTTHLVMVSDEADQSAHDASYYLSSFASYGDVTVHAIADHDLSCGINQGADGSAGYADAALATGGMLLDVCNASWAGNVAALAEAAVGNLGQFALSHADIDMSTFEVLLDGVAMQGGYAVNNGVLTFDERPDEGVLVEVKYGRQAVCGQP